MKAFTTFLQLPRTEKHLVLLACCYHLIFRLLIAIRPLETLIRRVMASPLETAGVTEQKISFHRCLYLITAGKKYIPYTTCLSRALATYTLLKKKGYQAELQIGITRDNSREFAAHAWLTYEDEIVLGYRDDLENYQKLPLNLHQNCNNK